ncbi:MAG TPA: thioredoxin domain-containing protein [Pyrinomonadaceae bacterium]|nr:thioredoxin domain-containing protein [Pyrinomonadaceae bacterium]
MSNEKKNSNNNNLPLVIIGLVLIAAVGAGWWFYTQSKTPSKKGGNTNTSVANTTKTPAIVSALGAQPPNMLGSPNSSVTVEEFADFQCPTCGVMHPKMKELNSIYGSRIKFIFRNYPLAIPAHDKAYDAAVAAEAAGLQGRFWDMQNLLFTNQQAWSANPDYRKVWEGYASQIGLDIEKFKNDMAGLNAKSRVDADLQRGRALNISSTPSLFVNGVLIPFEQMNIETLRQIIDSELQKGQSNQQKQPTSGAPTTPAPTAQTSQPASNTAANTAPKK